MSEVKIAAARQEQSKADKDSLLDRLKLKPRKTLDLRVQVGDEVVVLKFEAISSRELDKLREKHPPTKTQLAKNYGVNIDTFNPALVAATLVEPTMTEEEAREIFASDYWSSGELAQIAEAASTVCLNGFDVPSIASV